MNVNLTRKYSLVSMRTGGDGRLGALFRKAIAHRSVDPQTLGRRPL